MPVSRDCPVTSEPTSEVKSPYQAPNFRSLIQIQHVLRNYELHKYPLVVVSQRLNISISEVFHFAARYYSICLAELKIVTEFTHAPYRQVLHLLSDGAVKTNKTTSQGL